MPLNTEADDIRQVARIYQYDRYLAALLAPREHREALVILAAFAGELQRIPLIVSEPMMAAIRLQWWRETLEATARPGAGDAKSGHLLADALRDTARRYGLPFGLLQGMIDATETELDPMPLNEATEVRQLLAKFDGAAFELAGRVLGSRVGRRDIWRQAAEAYGYARLAAETDWRERVGAQTFVTRDLAAPGGLDVTDAARHFCNLAATALDAFRADYPKLDQPTRCALLPLATVTPLLRAVGVASQPPGERPIALSPFARARVLLWAKWRRRV